MTKTGATNDAGTTQSPHVLREYALLADGERGALVGPRGDIEWMCAPGWANDPIFSSLIGGQGGYAIRPTGRFVWGGYYEDGTLIWRNRWVTDSGIVECREALAFPGDPHRLVLLRRLVAVDGPARIRIILDPRAAFGQRPLRDLARDSGIWRARCGPLFVRWSGAPDAHRTDCDELTVAMRLDEGQHHDLVLEVSDQPLPSEPPAAETAWADTERAWHRSVPTFASSLAPRDTRHAYAVLRGLTSSSGGMVAAATMSLPESSEQGRNYDYRYVWIRDQALAGQAVAAAGPYELLDDAVAFVCERIFSDGPQLSPAYTVDGGRIPDQGTVDLPGYPGGHNITGNHVNEQFQLDVFGESLLLLAAATRHDRLDAHSWRAAEISAHAIAERWQESEAGFWELDDHRWTESRLICAAGLRAVAKIANGTPSGREWSSLADRILDDTAAHATHPSGRWQRSWQDDRVDAALLIPPLRGAPSALDARTVATMKSVQDALADDYYLYRFRHQEGPLAGAEGAFLMCGFAMAMAQHQQGNQVEAVRWFERNRAACGPAGLFSEEYDVVERQLRGNLPQAFVHAMLLEASVRLAEAPDHSD